VGADFRSGLVDQAESHPAGTGLGRRRWQCQAVWSVQPRPASQREPAPAAHGPLTPKAITPAEPL
jgi:hypothetical protein